MMTKEEKAVISLELARFREQTVRQNWSIRKRLTAIPFWGVERLFGLTLESQFPCYVFGKQLVLKIVDELLDEERREE